MAVEILMPELGESVHEGTVSRWLKKEGEQVKEDEPLVEIMTDKVNTELPSPATGTLKKIMIAEGESVKVFEVMGVIDDKGDMSDAVAPKKDTRDLDSEKVDTSKFELLPAIDEVDQTDKTDKTDKRTWLTPVVRAIAKEHNISENELNQLCGSGEDGRVTKKDVEGYIQKKESLTLAPVPVPVPDVDQKVSTEKEVVALTGMRKMIADAMTKSSLVPTVSTLIEVDVTRLVNFRTQNRDIFKTQFGVKLTYTPFFIKVLSETLMEYPAMNSSLQDDKIHLSNEVHLGIAVALGSKGEKGLIVPVIRNANQKTLIEIAKELEGIANKARNNDLGVGDVKGGTFTLTNPGSYGAVSGTPMISTPQAGIIGIYSIRKTAVVIEDMIAIRSMLNIVLTYDHRIIDGALAGRFLQTVKSKLENFDFFK